MAITTNNFLAEVVDHVYDAISHIGIGDGVSAITAANTLLVNEVERKAATMYLDDTTVIAEAYWDETEGNGVTYTEAGCFWDGATATIDTGALAVGGQINVPKDATQTLTVSIEILIEAVNS